MNNWEIYKTTKVVFLSLIKINRLLIIVVPLFSSLLYTAKYKNCHSPHCSNFKLLDF